MELSVGAYASNGKYYDMTFDEQIDMFCNAGFYVFDFSPHILSPWMCPGRDGFVGDSWRPFIEKAAESIKKRGARVGQCHGLMWEDVFDKPDLWEAFESGSRKMYEIAKILETKIIVLHPLICREYKSDPGKALAANVDYFRAQAELADRYGLSIAVENVFFWPTYDYALSWRFGASPIEELIELVEAVDLPNVGICLDTGHANCSALNVSEAAERIGEHLIALHIHDNNGRYDSHLIPFHGNIDWPSFMKSLAKIGYKGTFSFECMAPWVHMPNPSLCSEVIEHCYKVGCWLTGLV